MPSSAVRGGAPAPFREVDHFRRFLTAKARGARGSYADHLHDHFSRSARPDGAGGRAPTAIRIEPVAGGTHRTNMGLLNHARHWGFEGSYQDFLRAGYEVQVQVGEAPVPAAPGAATAVHGAARVVNPLVLIALMLQARLAALEADIERSGLPRRLRTTAPEPQLPSDLDAALQPMPARTQPRLRLARLLPVQAGGPWTNPMMRRIAWLKAQIANHEAELERRETPERLRTTTNPSTSVRSSLSAALAENAGPQRNPRAPR